MEKIFLGISRCTVFENHRKGLIQHCEQSELRLHFEWTKMPKMINFGEFLKTQSLRSNSVTRHVNFNRTKIGGKYQTLKCNILSDFQRLWDARFAHVWDFVRLFLTTVIVVQRWLLFAERFNDSLFSLTVDESPFLAANYGCKMDICTSQCLKITEKVSFNIASEAS